MQQAMSVDSKAGTSSYWVMTCKRAILISSVFRDRAKAKLTYFPISAAMFCMRTHFLYYSFWLSVFITSFYLIFWVILTPHVSYFVDFRQLQLSNVQTKYYKILPAYRKIPHIKTCEISNRYFEPKYHFLALPKILITLEQGCTIIGIFG